MHLTLDAPALNPKLQFKHFIITHHSQHTISTYFFAVCICTPLLLYTFINLANLATPEKPFVEMMQRCSSTCGQCSCGLYHTSNNSFSMIFSSSNSIPFDHDGDIYSPSSSVDCTLSLGTPSTRLTNENEKKRYSCMSNFGWNILQSKPPPTTGKHSGAVNNSTTSSGGGDPLLSRRCANCDTTSTPLWRNGPRGPKSLCNACGIRFKKEERRATAANNGGATAANNSSWAHHHSQNQKMPCFSSSNYANEFRFIEENDDLESEHGIPFLTWRFNVTDRPNFVHDFTR